MDKEGLYEGIMKYVLLNVDLGHNLNKDICYEIYTRPIPDVQNRVYHELIEYYNL